MPARYAIYCIPPCLPIWLLLLGRSKLFGTMPVHAKRANPTFYCIASFLAVVKAEDSFFGL